MALEYDDLLAAVSGGAVGIRARIALEPLGGPGDKIFPPTYAVDRRAETQYAIERRRIPTRRKNRDGESTADRRDTEIVEAVVLDSVASQANRMELALLAAARRNEIRMPIVSVDFEPYGLPGIGRITSLEAPHRIFDAILRDSLIDGTLFRLSEIGQQITEASPRNVTALYRYAPHTLVFGGWDSTGPRGGRGARYERALTSEIVALGIDIGRSTESRIDPLGIERRAGPVYVARDDARKGYTWTVDTNAAKWRGRSPIKVQGPDDDRSGLPSAINHGNVPPRINERAGGITADKIIGTTVLSLIQLRRLGFSTTTNGRIVNSTRRAAVEAAGRTALAALGLTAIVLAFEEGFDLRSRCVLRATDELRFELVPRGPGDGTHFTLDRGAAIDLLARAISQAAQHGLEWGGEEILLYPIDSLIRLVERSQPGYVPEGSTDVAKSET